MQLKAICNSCARKYLRFTGLSTQILLVMRLTTFMLLIAALQVSAKGKAQTITYSAKAVSLQKVLNAIKVQTGAVFFYDKEDLKDSKLVSVELKNTSLESAMEMVLRQQPLSYEIHGKTIFITKDEKKVEKPVVAELVPAPPPPVTISGKVTDENGAPIPNVSVVVKGTQKGAITHPDGTFQLTGVPDNGVLVITSLGYVTKEVNVGGKVLINISLSPDVSSLRQLVVVGYGTQKKTSVTAAIATLKGKDVAATPVTNLSNSLGGRVPGVIVRQNNGEPGNDGSNIYIRGIASTSSNNQPLLIVDGIPRDFKQLDPNTIESFTVLKDAAAVAPYGVAAANGVILVTTKSGKTGAPSVTYNGYIGIQNPTVFPKYVNGYQFGILQNAAAKNAGLPLPYSDYALQKLKDGSDQDAYPDPNVYRDLITKNAILTNHNIEVSGGSEKVKYYSSFGYQSQNGMWPTTNNKKYNLDMNLNAQVTPTTKLTFGVNGRVQNATYPSITTGRLFELIGYTHTQNGPLYFSNGVPGTYITASLLNSGYNKINTTTLYSQLSIDQELPFIPGLKSKVTVAYDPTTVMNKLWRTPVHKGTVDTSQHPYVITDGIFEQTKSSLNQSFAQSHQLTYQASLSYARMFGKSNVNALVLFEAKDNYNSSLSASRRNYNLNIDEINMGSSSAADMTTGGASTQARQVGVVYRVTYDYADKYLFEASARYDGSYYFPPESRFGFFPAFSVGWRLSEEGFMKQITWINNLKIRGSYGEVGALAGSPFQYLSTFSVSGPAYVLGGQAVQAAKERNESNPNITWERAKKSDVGIEATLWEGLLNIEADYFYEKRSNMLMNPDVVVPAEYGVGLSQVNAGIMKNQGIDLSIGSSYKVSNDLQVSLSGNITYAKNTLLKVFETATTYNNPNRRITDKALGTQFGYKAIGFFQLADFDDAGALKPGIAKQPWGAVKPGDIRYEDISGDGKIDDNDIVKIGDPVVPQLIYGISPSVKYKNFTLDVFFQGAAKTNLYQSQQNAWAFHNGMSALVENMNYWTPENPNALNPRITSGPTTNNTQMSSFWMKDASYLRLKSATFSYTLPSSISGKIGSQHARVYVSGQNIFTWSKLKNFDPESTDPYSNLYPQQQVFSVGANITF
jgi:TonB-linked SusC/RagA family outer membrane protein